MFWYKWQARPDSTGDTRAIFYLEGDYKAFEWLDEDLVESFNVRENVGERASLAAEKPDLTRELLAKLHATEAEIGDLRAEGRKAPDRRSERRGARSR